MQTVFQDMLGGQKSVWGANPGWQREIAFWNAGMALIVVKTLRLNDQRMAMAVVWGSTLLFLLLAVNHLHAFGVDGSARFHWPPLVVNTAGFLFGLRLLYKQGD